MGERVKITLGVGCAARGVKGPQASNLQRLCIDKDTQTHGEVGDNMIWGPFIETKRGYPSHKGPRTGKLS